ncbi:MAG: hypothetical protein DRP66_06760 [Planctomycetota bacterium]|nr:MAG: hypothetical protein DRP66_06760 [Planctomycetota bacterium]
MMKVVLLLMGVWACSSVSYAVWDYTIGDGQYEYGSVRLYNDKTLLVTGGGAYGVEAFDSSYVKVQGTAPLEIDVGGIYVLDLDDSSSLLVTGGEIGGIAFRDNATAVLRGGSILHISSFQRPLGGDYPPSYWDKHITIEYSGELPTVDGDNLLTGLWPDGSAFSIQLHDGAGVFYPAITNIEFVPEPMTLLLFGFGGLAVRELGKRSQLK